MRTNLIAVGRFQFHIRPCYSMEGLDNAIRGAQSRLLELQADEGYWMGELVVDATVAADLLAYHHWNGSVDPAWQAKIIRHILDLRTESGGWNIYKGGPDELNATVKAYLSLKLAGYDPNSPMMQEIRDIAVRLGGIPKLHTFSKLYFALLGLFPWEGVPTIPCEVMLVGRWSPINIHEMSSWSRAILVPLAIINNYKPTRKPAPDFNLDELYPEDFQPRDLHLPRDPNFFSWRNFFLLVDKGLKIIEKQKFHPFRKKALKAAEKWMLERFEGSDGLAAIFPGLLNSLIALKAMGYPDDHFQIQRVERELKRLERETEDSIRVEPCLSPIWDTAINAIALHESGMPEDHPALIKAIDFLLEKEVRFRGDWAHKNPAPVEPSGWAFEFNNQFFPDTDDTAMVIMALKRISGSDASARNAALKRAIPWLLSFQCKGGGWAAFDKDCAKPILEKVPFADHNAMLDPECADITAKVLEMLGKLGYGKEFGPAQRAIQFLKNTQESDGSWYGRWGVNYVYGTWQALRGLKAIGVDMTEEWVQKALSWLESVQNPDGGWGERCDTYDDPSKKGQGPSTASQTAWAVMALSAFEVANRPSLQRGVRFLIDQQVENGEWIEDEVTGTGFPSVFYLRYDMYRISWPLLALATYRGIATKEEEPKQLSNSLSWKQQQKENPQPAMA